ncbi:MAG: hypothetical protein ABI769_00820 [Pseudomonadota bacterium]
MKDASAILTVLLIALPAMAANAQTATSPVRQVRPVPSVTTPAARTTTTTTATPVTPYGTAAARQTVPANIFKLEDRAIIIVGGKQVMAGDVKRQLVSELRQTDGPATIARTRSRAQIPVGVPVRDDPTSGIKQRRPSDRLINGGIAAASVSGQGREALIDRPAMSYADMQNYCKVHPLEITRIRGTITPGRRFTIEGNCFGDQTGAVEVIGQFPGGNMRFVFDSWSDYEIRVFVPPVSGATDHAIALTVVRLPDKARSPNVQAQFIAAREIVSVPAKYWTPTADFLQIDIDQGGGNIFGGYTVFGTGPAEARLAPFSLHVNPACGLDTAGASVRSGAVLAINGWEDGPPYQANVNVAWAPRCVIQTTNYVVASSSQRICDIDFTLSAQASCPVGVAP